MRVTGAGNIYLPVSETLSGKLPQSVISKKAAAGYSSYGNQIGLATTHVREIYHDDYVAKRLEVGAVVGAVKAANVRRARPAPGDKIIMFGGRTGRAGIGGAPGSSPESWTVCGGRGYVVTQQRTPFGVMQSQQPCSHCGGRGTIIRNPCKTCRGTGKTAARKSLEINIPAGIDDDQNIALRGQGDAGSNGGPAGDVIVHVTVKADPMFERDGYDVTIHVPITFSQAVLGDDVEVPTVDGRIVQHIPEGTQSGTKFRLRGQGIQYLNGRGRGDQYVIVDVEIPKKVTRAQREALKAFEDSMKEDNYEKRKGFFKNLRDRFS